jgi:hypothetical protein
MGSMDAATAGLFLMAVAESFNVYSALTSSPWTMESFGADERKAKAAKVYVMYALGANFALGVGTSILAGSWAPLAGIAIISLWMTWVYFRALRKGQEAGSSGWTNS